MSSVHPGWRGECGARCVGQMSLAGANNVKFAITTFVSIVSFI
jgi:hypothetical protein